MRYLEAFPPVAGDRGKQVVDALGGRFRGRIYRASYPVVDGHFYRGDAEMWVFEGQPEVARRFRDVLDEQYHGMFALVTEEEVLFEF